MVRGVSQVDVSLMARLFSDGFTLKEIAGRVGPDLSRKSISYESVRTVLKESGSYDLLIKKREEGKLRVRRGGLSEDGFRDKEKRIKEEKEQLRWNRLLNLLNTEATEFIPAPNIELYESDQWAFEKIIEYDTTRTKGVASRKDYTEHLERVFNLLRIYRLAEISGAALSFDDLEKRTGIFFTNVGKTLKKFGLKPMNPHLTFAGFKNWKFNKKVYDLPMPAADLAYFSGKKKGSIDYCLGVVKLGLNRDGLFEKPRTRYGNIKRFSKNDEERGNRTLNYRVASQIYRLLDLKPDVDPAEELSLDQRVVDYARNEEELIKPVIVKALNLFHPKVGGNQVPYLLEE
jgi:hypothetical protein